MAGLPYQQLEQDTPESIVDNYLQRGLQDIQQRLELQWNEVNRRGPMLGQRKQFQMLSELNAKAQQEAQEFQQQAQQQTEQLQRIDRLAQQAGIDSYESKMRLVLGPEEEAARFPKPMPEERPPSASELRSYESWLERKAPDFMTVPSKRVKAWLRAKPGGYLGAAWPWKEKMTGPVRMVYDPGIEPKEEKGVWTKGGYRPATQKDIQEKMYFDTELKKVRQELRSQPDIAVRIRSAALRVKRDPEHTSLITKVEASKPKPKAPPAQGPVKFISPDGKKTYTISSERVAEFTKQFPAYKRAR